MKNDHLKNIFKYMKIAAFLTCIGVGLYLLAAYSVTPESLYNAGIEQYEEAFILFKKAGTYKDSYKRRIPRTVKTFLTGYLKFNTKRHVLNLFSY